MDEMRAAVENRIEEIKEFWRDFPETAKAFSEYAYAVETRPGMVMEEYGRCRATLAQVAEELEIRFQATIAQAKAILDKIVALADAEQGNSALLARMITTFENLGLFGAGRQILLPLLLAISLEIAALFGPALLLGRNSS